MSVAFALPARLRGSTPRPLWWSVADFHRIVETGVFEGRRPVLIRGTLIEQGTMNPPHAVCVDLTQEVLRSVFGTGWRIRVQLPLVLSLDTDPMPDVGVVAGRARDFTDHHPTTASLVVEVADSTLAMDLTEKAELYATAGVPDCWVIDLENRQLVVFRDPEPLPEGLGATAYRTRMALASEDSISPLAAPSSTVKVSDLLP